MPVFTESQIALFWEKVAKKSESECWPWLSGCDHTGRGKFSIRVGDKCSTFKAHRVSYFLTKGECPVDKLVCHHCDNGLCVNPAHLFLGTTQDNVTDKVNKGRQPRGEKQGSAILTDKDVINSRRWYAEGYSSLMIAKRLGVPRCTIFRAITGKTWGHLPNAQQARMPGWVGDRLIQFKPVPIE